MAVRSYSLNPNKPPFSALDDDDIASAFMNSSSATYLAADKLGPSYENEREITEEEQRRNDLLQQLKEVEQRTLDSSKSSLGMLIESEKVGIETAEDLSRQKDQLKNTEKRLDDIDFTLKDTQKNINGIKSVFSSLKQWWSTPKQPPANDEGNSGSTPISPSSVCTSEQSQLVLSKNLSSAVENSKLTLQFSSTSHPAMRLRGLEEEEEKVPPPPPSSDLKVRSQKVNQQLDEDLDTMSSGLSRLKELAQGLGTEIEDHNEMIDRIHTKADKTDVVMVSQNRQMKRILKK